MAAIAGGVATPHTPTIGLAPDTNKLRDAVGASIFESYRRVRQWPAGKKDWDPQQSAR
jgi:gallate dioxygenase